MAEITVGLAQQVVGLARRKALVKDAVKVLRGLQKKARPAPTPSHPWRRQQAPPTPAVARPTPTPLHPWRQQSAPPFPKTAARRKALVTDAVKVLQGLQKQAKGVGCPGAKLRSGGLGRGLGRGMGKGPIGGLGRGLGRGMGRGPIGIPVGTKDAPEDADSKKKKGKKGKKGKKSPFPKKAVVLASVVSLLKAAKLRAKTSNHKQGIVKAAAVAIVAIKRGNQLQKQAAIGDLLKKILPFLGKQLGRVGGAATSLGGKLPGKALPGMLSPGKAPGLLSRLGAGVGTGLKRGGKAVSALGGRLNPSPAAGDEQIMKLLSRLKSGLGVDQPGIMSPGISSVPSLAGPTPPVPTGLASRMGGIGAIPAGYV